MAKKRKNQTSLRVARFFSRFWFYFYSLRWVIVALIVVSVLIFKSPTFNTANYKLVLEYIEAIIWPLVVAFGLWLLRGKLAVLVDNLEELSVMGNKAKFKHPPQTDPPKESVAKPDNETLENFEEKSIHPEPATNDHTSTSNLKQRVNFLEIELEFERIFRNIYGTQILALKRLKDYPEGVKIDDLFNLLPRHQKLMGPGNAYNDVVELMGYLSSFRLVEYVARDSLFKITLKGDVFVNYLLNQGLSELNRPY